MEGEILEQKATPRLGLATFRKRRVNVGFPKVMSEFSARW
jgi:hypothetical protein